MNTMAVFSSLKGLAVFHYKTQFTKAFKFNLNIQRCVKGVSAPKHQPINYIHVYWSTICFTLYQLVLTLLMTVRILKPRSFPKLNDFPYSAPFLDVTRT